MFNPSLPQDISQIQNIIWLQTAFLGDIVLTTGALRLTTETFPDARQHLITTPVGAAALGAFPGLSTIIPYDKRAPDASFAEIKRAVQAIGTNSRNTVLIQPHRSWRSSLLARYIGLPTITYRESRLSFLASARVERVAVLHESVRIALLLQALGVTRERCVEARPLLPALPKDDKQIWQQSIDAAPRPLIGIAPGSKWGTKCWPILHFAALADALYRSTRGAFVLLGSAEEQELVEPLYDHIIEHHPDASVFNLAGKTSFDDLRRLYPQLQLVIANDSSPIHYASAFDVPTVAIFGSTVPGMGFGPRSRLHRIAENTTLDCRPCSDHGPQDCPLQHFKCMRELSPTHVSTLCLEILKLQKAL